MVLLARAIVEAILQEFSPEEFLRRISHPGWFQALGCVLGFDWHSSGLTTTTVGALKEALAEISTPLLMAAGGKGRVAIRTPHEIEALAERYGFSPAPFIRASRLSAKVDSALLQDGYNLYHHAIFFTSRGYWAVVQQGMREDIRLARRYHWLSEDVEDFVEEPHSGISAERRESVVLNLTSRSSSQNREVILDLSRQSPQRTEEEVKKLITLTLPRRHALLARDIRPENLRKAMAVTYERSPSTIIELLEIRGVGAKFLRALSLVADLVYGAKASFEDPALYSFAHGGKDGTPYPVDRAVYDRTIEVMEKAIKKAKMGEREKLAALKRLSQEFSAP